MDYPKKSRFESADEFKARVKSYHEAEDERAERAIERYYERRHED